MSDVRLVLTTFPDLETARRTGRVLVEEGLAACINLLPGVESIYRWQGKVDQAAEVLGILKTTTDGCQALEQRLAALHPYEVPEIVAMEPAAVSARYAEWLTGSVKPEA
ncbi:MAG: Divalent-cation tolerance protein CutA [Prosthecobacter sp.]|nr:Divalent-cation tolerance protein CutA [Prosthecobacter sp.]